jgi:hypothetical protein
LSSKLEMLVQADAEDMEEATGREAFCTAKSEVGDSEEGMLL